MKDIVIGFAGTIDSFQQLGSAWSFVGIADWKDEK